MSKSISDEKPIFGRLEVSGTKKQKADVTTYVKHWRAVLAEKLLKQDIDDLKEWLYERFKDRFDELIHEQEAEFDHRVDDKARRLMNTAWKEYKWTLDDYILDNFPEFQPSLIARPYKENEVLEVTPLIERRIDERHTIKVMPRFVRKVKNE